MLDGLALVMNVYQFGSYEEKKRPVSYIVVQEIVTELLLIRKIYVFFFIVLRICIYARMVRLIYST